MTASESATGTSDLHKSIEQLIAETVKHAHVSSDAEKEQLTGAMRTAVGEIEASQQALERAASVLRTALGNDTLNSPVAPLADPIPSNKEEPTEHLDQEATIVPATDRGVHELDVIAHHASIGNASGLQSMLRALPEVTSAQTREFVNGELRLQVSLTNGLDMTALSAWLGERSGELVTSTDSVIEIRFAS